MRILFVTSNRVGDAVLSTGLLDHLIRAHPKARITVACGPYAEGIFARVPNRERTIILRKRRWNAHWLGLWAWAAGRRWDLVVDVRGSALGWMVRTRRRAAMRSRTWGEAGTKHKVVQLASMLGLDPPPAPVAWIAAQDHARAKALLPADQPVIALGPTANWAPKIWPAERFAALFRTLAGDMLPGAIPAVLGGPGEAERAMAAPLLALLPEAIDLVGTLSLPEAAACLVRAALFVGNDSGLMHLAAATGAPTIGLFGPTPAAEYAPIGRCAASVVAADGRMAGITVSQVLTEVAALVAHPPPKPLPKPPPARGGGLP
ncbi:MAG TPA: glycosyltransferase family 9 protein, partial [Acetobacteraceae bacterium]|nr:glycosyltransferase family 9 protein [Acetobacteraceae bacterium]